MGAIIGTLIFIAVVYNIIMAFKPSIEEQLNKFLDRSYKALDSHLESVKKITNGFRWKTNEYGTDGSYVDIHITVEERANVNKAFLRIRNDDRKYGLLFRFIYEMNGEDSNLSTDEDFTKFVMRLNNYASICNPLETLPFITEITEKNNKKYINFLHFMLIGEEEMDTLKEKFEMLGDYEAIKKLAFAVLNSSNDFIDEAP